MLAPGLYNTQLPIFKQAFLVGYRPNNRMMCCMACRFCRAVLALYRASLPSSQPGGGSTAPRHLGSHHHMSQCKPSAATPLLLFLLYFLFIREFISQQSYCLPFIYYPNAPFPFISPLLFLRPLILRKPEHLL